MYYILCMHVHNIPKKYLTAKHNYDFMCLSLHWIWDILLIKDPIPYVYIPTAIQYYNIMLNSWR